MFVNLVLFCHVHAVLKSANWKWGKTSNPIRVRLNEQFKYWHATGIILSDHLEALLQCIAYSQFLKRKCGSLQSMLWGWCLHTASLTRIESSTVFACRILVVYAYMVISDIPNTINKQTHCCLTSIDHTFLLFFECGSFCGHHKLVVISGKIDYLKNPLQHQNKAMNW